MRKFTTICLATALAATMAIPAFAATTWLVDPAGYEGGVNNGEWKKAETDAQWNRWASQCVAQVKDLPTQMDKFKKISEIVKSYFTYDWTYNTAFDAYSIRDGKGTCEDYVSATMALCHEVGIEAYKVGGSAYGNPHSWNIVYLDGIWYWADNTDSETGDSPMILVTTLDDNYSTGAIPKNATEYASSSIFYKNTENVGYSGGIEKADGGSYDGTFGVAQVFNKVAYADGTVLEYTQEQLDRLDKAIETMDVNYINTVKNQIRAEIEGNK